MTHCSISTNTMVLCSPVSGMFANPLISLEGIELAKFNGQEYKGGSETYNGIHPNLTKQSTRTCVQRLIPVLTNCSTWDHYIPNLGTT